jgi:hypothetical protein
MARNKTKICLGCQCLFEARRDAKTCSARCRKRFQRAQTLFFESKSAAWQSGLVSLRKEAVGSRGSSYAK